MANFLFFENHSKFESFGIQHLVAVLFFFTCGIILIKWAKKLPKEKQIYIEKILSYSLSFSIVLWTFLKIIDRGFDIKHDLPFQLCNFTALLLPVFTITRKKIYFEIIFFWILAGTSQAIITPDLAQGFPNYNFIKYWYVHSGLIIYVFYVTTVYQIYPTLKSVFKSFIAIQGYFLLMLIVNKMTNANYFYISRKPNSATLLDYLGDWPYYIFTAELIILPYFLLIYFPFYLTKKRISSK